MPSQDLDIQRFSLLQSSPMLPPIGPTIASAATIAPTALVHTVSGAAAIATVTPPLETFHVLIFIPSGAFTMTAAGNIATAVGASVVGQPVLLFYNPVIRKYYAGKLTLA